MSESDKPVVDQGGASAPPDVVSGVLADGGMLRSSEGAEIAPYEVLSSWALPNGAKVGRLRMQLHGVTYVAQASVAVGSTVSFLSPTAQSAKAKAAYEKAQASRAKKAGAPTPAPAASPAQQLQATHAQPPVVLETTVRSLRRHVVVLLKTVDPVGYRKYAEIKYAGTDSPSLGQRRRAYVFAFQRLLDIGYLTPNVD